MSHFTLIKVKESEKADLKFNIQKTKIMVSDPITSWQIDAETMKTMKDYFLELQKRKSLPVSTVSPSICHEVMGPDAMILVF